MDGDPFRILKQQQQQKPNNNKTKFKERSGFIGFTNGEGKLTDEEKRANRRDKHKIRSKLIKETISVII